MKPIAYYSLAGLLLLAIAGGGGAPAKCDDATAISLESNKASAGYAHPGYEILTTMPTLSADFDDEVFNNTWQVWEEPTRSLAEAATPEERRRMAFARYGLTTAPGDTTGKPQQYVVDARGNWTMNCLSCHQGKVAGRVIPGVPNSLFALQTMMEEIRATKIIMDRKLTRMDLASTVFPLGTTNGTTNAVMFGVALMSGRDAKLNLTPRLPPPMTHHDHDAPAWWVFKKKTRLYCDGFSPKGHRPLMQFMLTPENGPEVFTAREADFQVVYEWLESLEVPKYPFAIDEVLAQRGELVFNRNCAECHGTYGEHETYPNKIVPIELVDTDPVRLGALSPEHRRGFGLTWFADFGASPTIADPGGYVAPPLDGIWASAPYFHNGSVPTLWHLLNSNERPKVWRRSEDGYDQARVGVDIEVFDQVPEEHSRIGRERRKYFDTTKPGKSAQGHTFPDALDHDEKLALLEYLKTL